MQQIIGRMSKTFPLMIVMGFMIVLASLVIGFFNSQNAAAYFTETKAVRETALLAERALIESTGLWLPYFKFLGLGLILGGIVMALRVIIDNLKGAGKEVLSNLPGDRRPSMPKPPVFASWMPILMMLGELVFIIALIASLGLAAEARDLYANPIPEIDAAGAGSTLLSQLEGIQSTSAWLVPFKFFGIATEFLAIVFGLGTIITILGAQTRMIEQGIEAARGQVRRKAEVDPEKATA
jgi:hypothetical protein